MSIVMAVGGTVGLSLFLIGWHLAVSRRRITGCPLIALDYLHILFFGLVSFRRHLIEMLFVKTWAHAEAI